MTLQTDDHRMMTSAKNITSEHMIFGTEYLRKPLEITDLGPKDHQSEMAHRESKGHVTDDVT